MSYARGKSPILSPEYMQIVSPRVDELMARIEKAESLEEVQGILGEMANEAPSPEMIEAVKAFLKKEH